MQFFNVFNSNPGLPCRGSSGGSAKEVEVVSSAAGEDKESEQKADTKQQKPKSSRTKQQQQQQQLQQQTSQENTSSKQLSRANSASYPRQQQGYQRMGNAGMYKSTMYNRSRYTYNNNYGNQRQQQYNPSRRFYGYQSNGGRGYNPRYNAGGGGNSGRYQQKWTPYQGGQQHGSSSYSSSSDQGMNRPHNPSRSKVHTSSSGSSDHNSKSVTPVPATNATASTEDHNRNVPQFNNNYLSGGAGKFSPKSFTSFPSSPQNHHSSINGEMAMSSNMIVPQTATDSAPMTTSKEREEKAHRWHFTETVSDRQRLEVPDPKLWNWTSSSGDSQFRSRQQGDYAETVEDPFPTMTVGGDDKEFAFKDVCMDDLDAGQVTALFPALKSDIPGRYDTTAIHHPPAQCTNRSDAQAHMLAGSGGGYPAVHNLNNN